MKTLPRPLVQTNRTFIVLSVIAALVLQLYLLLLPLAVGLSALVLKYNPVMHLSKFFLRKPAARYPQEDRADQQFNQLIAVCCIGLSVISFAIGWEFFGYFFAILVIIAASIALMGFCIGCYIRFKYIQWKHSKDQSEKIIAEDKT